MPWQATAAGVGVAGGALVAFFLGGPAMLANGSDAERAWTAAAAAAGWALLAAALGWLARWPMAGAAVAAGATPVVVLLVAAEPGAWPVGAALAAGIAGAGAVGAAVGMRGRDQRGRP